MRRTAGCVVVDFAELSDPGLDPTKQVNEDASGFASDEHGHLAVVCDGMGGHSGGREASQLAVKTILERYAKAPEQASAHEVIGGAVEAAGTAVYLLGSNFSAESRPGATCVAALIAEPGALIAHVGDSRAQLVRGDGVYPLTRDHSMVQQLVDAGVIPAHEAARHPDANKITRALGMTPKVEVEVTPTWQQLRADDVLLLMTDGVSDLVEPHELRDLVRDRLRLGTAVICEEVIELAKARGAHDNATIQVVHILETPTDTESLDRERTSPGGRRAPHTRALGTTRWSSAPGPPPRTMVDEEDTEPGLRTTELNVAPLHFEPLRRSKPPLRPVPRPRPAPVRPRSRLSATLRTTLFVAVGIALLVALTASLALFVRFMRTTRNMRPEPPAATDTAAPAPLASRTLLLADPEPAPPPSVGADAPLLPSTVTSAAPSVPSHSPNTE